MSGYPTDESARLPLFGAGGAGPQLFLCAPTPSAAWFGLAGGWHLRWQDVIPMGYKAVVGFQKRAVLSAGRVVASWSALSADERGILDAGPCLDKLWGEMYSTFEIFLDVERPFHVPAERDEASALAQAEALSTTVSGPVMLAERLWHTNWH